MGVPALFRWLSKKYPRIVEAVQEEEPRTAPGPDGTTIQLPLDTSTPNPNGEEFDCLYLDMNGIVHPCTHPEGKPAPETEEEMMVEVFAYTERVVSMVRPRRLLMMAIDGVAPRAKMNQQRSRRFRAAKEAREKQQESENALAEWKARGLPVNEALTQHNKKAWDSNAITPGTPFMDLLAASLRYWVAQKINTDPGWKDLQVVISDASVPGEGEHKIMEHIRRQRSHPEHDPNTKHVIYGLDADLIMLSLATHEPYFKVLREDVFAQDSKPKGCHKCGKFGHIAANCTNPPKVEEEKPEGPPERKPFIFLDVATLREYLAVELDVPNLPFAFDLERALDDWVFLIFFVGNDFLPHLPSLEIREGAIDTLLKLWKSQLPLMGGYLTNHGKVELARAQLILDGLSSQEDDIFRRRREEEERREANIKRREDQAKAREQQQNEQGNFGGGDMVPVIQKRKPANETEKPAFNGTSAQDARDQANANNKSYDSRRKAVVLGGDNNDVVRDRNAARQANKDAAAALKAELMGDSTEPPAKKVRTEGDESAAVDVPAKAEDDADPAVPAKAEDDKEPAVLAKAEDDTEPAVPAKAGPDAPVSAGTKRKADDLEDGAEAEVNGEAEASAEADDADEADDKTLEDEDPVTETNKKRVVNSDGTVDYEDTVKMWEPGYRERYYKEKFGVDLADKDFRRQVVKSYVEGLSWVLAYYYQGVPSWQWYYPYHFSPFAADFEDLASLDIKFELGAPFKPFEQLMGVLPADSRASIPPAFHPLMTESDSEIFDFYPTDFDIDMNGKKMAWQGVALLPFIDEKRLLDALKDKYGDLTPDEVRRNGFGNSTLFVGSESRLYESFCEIYAKGTAAGQPTPMNAALSGGITGFVKADPVCVPGSTFDSPLTSQNLDDIHNDRSISVLYDFPDQKTPHRSVLLKGLKPPKPVLTHSDIDWVKRGGGGDHRGGGRGRGRGGHFGGGGPGRGGGAGGSFNNNSNNGHQNYNAGGARGGHFNANGGGAYSQPVQAYGGGGGYGGYGGYGQHADPYAQHADPYAGYGGYGAAGQAGYGAPAGAYAAPPGGPPTGPRYDNPYAAYPANHNPYSGPPANGGYAGLPSLGGPPAAPAPGGYVGYGAGGYGGYGAGGYGGYGGAPAPNYGYGAGGGRGGGYAGGPPPRGGGAPAAPRGGGAPRGGFGRGGGAYNNTNNGSYGGQGGAYGSFY